MRKRVAGRILGPLLMGLIWALIPEDVLSAQASAVLGISAWVVIWWITEAIPIPATSLLPLVLLPLSGALTINETASCYAKPIIFLFIGGFILALAMERWNLHRRIALRIILAIGAQPQRIILGFMMATGLLSMWISNTATTMMMMPIAMAILSQFADLKEATLQQKKSRFGQSLMLSIAYAASIGGLATLIGTPTNVILNGFVAEFYGKEISFAQWMAIGVPLSLALLLLAWVHLAFIAFPTQGLAIPGGSAVLRGELKKLGPISPEEKSVMAVFCTVALAWMIREPLLSGVLPGLSDYNIALAGALVLFVIPSRKPTHPLMDWETAVRLPWGILLLFGGGFAIAAGFQETGLAAWIGQRLSLLEGASLFLLLLSIITLVNFLTELTMNMATCTMILPVMAALAAGIGVPPMSLMVAATLASSCAFMLPVATAPNAIVFGSGFIRMEDMVRAGFMLNLISILMILLAVYFLLPVMWDI